MTSLKFPRLGLGAIVIDDPSVPWVTPENYFQLLDSCLDFGVGYIDSAQIYGDCEKYLGEWILNESSSEKLKSLLIGSKISGMDTSEEDLQPHTEEYIIRIAKQSLDRIKVSQMDIYWLHGPDPSTPWIETMKGFDFVARNGIAKKIGLCNVSGDQISEVLELCENNNLIRPEFIQNRFNLIAYHDQDDVLKICKKESLHFMGFSPLAGGILTGKYGFDSFPEDSRWRHWSQTRSLPSYWTKDTFERIEQLKNLAKSLNLDPATLALGWSINHKDIGTTLLGPRHTGHIEVIQKARNLVTNNFNFSQVEEIFNN